MTTLSFFMTLPLMGEVEQDPQKLLSLPGSKYLDPGGSLGQLQLMTNFSQSLFPLQSQRVLPVLHHFLISMCAGILSSLSHLVHKNNPLVLGIVTPTLHEVIKALKERGTCQSHTTMKQRQGDPMVLLSALAARPGKLVIATLGIGPPPGHGLVIPLLTAGVNKKGRKSQDATV